LYIIKKKFNTKDRGARQKRGARSNYYICLLFYYC